MFPPSVRRSSIVIAAAILSGVSVLVGTSPAGAAVVGSPQPGVATFSVGPDNSGGGTAAVLPNGSIVTVRMVTEPGTGGAAGEGGVCVLQRGARTCSSRAVLKPFDSELEGFGSPIVYATGGEDVDVVVGMCCDGNPNDDILYRSTNGGVSFTAGTRVGSSAVDGGVLASGHLVWVDNESSQGTVVQSVPVGTKVPAAGSATVSSADVTDQAVTTYHGGVLVAADDDASTNVSQVFYAPAGSNFDKASSYRKVGQFTGARVASISGSALLTLTAAGTPVLRFFDGTGYGTRHVVPQQVNGLDGDFIVGQTPTKTYAFYNDARADYDTFIEWTANGDGTHWSDGARLGAYEGGFSGSPALDDNGTGVLFSAGGGGAGAWVQPVLNVQVASLALRPGDKVTGSVTPILSGATVILQRLSGSDTWTGIGTTTESSSGTYALTVPAGKATYRVQIAGKPGYVEIGYSPQVKVG